jgi:DNA polymerase I
VYGRGSGKSGLWIYGEDLRESDIKAGLPFTGEPGSLLSTILKEVGIHEDDVFITNVVRCRPPKNRHAYAVEYKACDAAHTQLDRPATPYGCVGNSTPKLVMLLGALPLKTLLKKDKITENRGIFFDSNWFGCKVMATFHPGKVLRDPNLYDTVKVDFQKARDFLLDRKVEPPKIHRELINSRERFLSWMRILANPAITERYGDIETTGLIFKRHEIVSMAFATEIDGEMHCIGFLTRFKESDPDWWFADLKDPEIRAALQAVLNYPIDFHRSLFDVPWFWDRGFNLKCGMDTMDMHLLINENTPHNLKHLVTIYNTEGAGYQLKINEYTGGGEHLSEAPAAMLLEYNMEDVCHGYRLKQKFIPLLEQEGMTNFFNTMQMPLERTLTRMSYRGFMMDRPGIIDLSNKYRAQIKLKEEELFEMCHERFNYSSSSKDLPYVLFHTLKLPIIKRTEKTGAPATDKEVLAELAKVHPAPKLINELRWYKNMLVKYLDGDDLTPEEDRKPDLGFLCYLDDNDRIHAPFLRVGTISGRPSCPKPNLLNIPKNPEIRNLFIAPPGWSLIDIDYSQAELVLLAFLSKDPGFMEAVMSTDLHTMTAKQLMRSDTIDDEVRRKAKMINFLKAYGGGAKLLAERLKISEEEAKSWLHQWDVTYPMVPA